MFNCIYLPIYIQYSLQFNKHIGYSWFILSAYCVIRMFAALFLIVIIVNKYGHKSKQNIVFLAQSLYSYQEHQSKEDIRRLICQNILEDGTNSKYTTV